MHALAFEYRNATEICFGVNSFDKIHSRIPRGSRILFVYGGGSIKRTGIHQRLVRALEGFHRVEFGGIRSNPDYRMLVDAFVHVCEQYLTYPVGAPIQEGYCEAVLRTLCELGDSFHGPRPLRWRQNMMWAANQALSGILGLGVPQDWSTHAIGKALSILYDIDHAQTLSIVQPAVLRELMAEKEERLRCLGRNVFQRGTMSAAEVIAEIENRYRALAMPVRLRELGYRGVEAEILETLAGIIDGDIAENRLITPARLQAIVADFAAS